MAHPLARLGDPSDHGGTIISASATTIADGIGLARAGDLHNCPLPGHGITPMSSNCSVAIDGGRGVIRVGVSTDHAGCGAVISSGSPTVGAA